MAGAQVQRSKAANYTMREKTAVFSIPKVTFHDSNGHFLLAQDSQHSVGHAGVNNSSFILNSNFATSTTNFDNDILTDRSALTPISTI